MKTYVKSFRSLSRRWPTAAFTTNWPAAFTATQWMSDGLSDQERGGFYASQDADYSMDDDGDYFTWTLDEAKAVLSGDELQVAALRFDINEVGEMHHDPAKNVLYVRASQEE